MEFLITLIIVVALVAFVSAPLRRRGVHEQAADPRIADLEARKEAKYAEIRDTRLDHAAGKLSEEDFERQNAELRAEAVEILRELDEAAGTRS
jgi:hypothetical protein